MSKDPQELVVPAPAGKPRAKRGERKLAIDWSRLHAPVAPKKKLAEGIYLALLVKAAVKQSWRGTGRMFHVWYEAVGFDTELCQDNISVDGPGAFYGCHKLVALGFTEDEADELCAKDLVGRRAYIATHRIRLGKGERLNVKDDADGSTFGYFGVGKVPNGVVTLSGV